MSININELKAMNEKELCVWSSKVNTKELKIILKENGRKGYSKLKKAELLNVVLDMIITEEVEATDEKIKYIYEETKAINKEVNSRQSFEEELERTLYARWYSYEISLEELRKVVSKYKLDIPVMSNRENTIDIANRYGELSISEYIKGGCHIDTIGLEYLNNPGGKRYYGDEDKVWEYFKSNFGEVLEKKNIKDYQHLYAKMIDNSLNM